MNASIIPLLLAACASYVFLMSLLGKWLARNNRHDSLGAVLPRTDGSILGGAPAEIQESIAS